jgi:checkpoint serine/threonine-protein kinase
MADIDAIEASKENILPLATGRSASKLAGLLSRDKRAVDTELKQGHARFQRELETADADPECDDPLDPYHRSAPRCSLA